LFWNEKSLLPNLSQAKKLPAVPYLATRCTLHELSLSSLTAPPGDSGNTAQNRGLASDARGKARQPFDISLKIALEFV
jgi:hypothetical protein